MLQNENSIAKRRYDEIMAMPDTPEKTAAIQEWARDYPGEAEMLQADRTFGEKMVQQESPRGGVAGPSSNPFSIYVAANPLEHAAAGAEKYMGYKNRKKAQTGLEELSDARQQALINTVRGSMYKDPEEEETMNRYRGYQGRY